MSRGVSEELYFENGLFDTHVPFPKLDVKVSVRPFPGLVSYSVTNLLGLLLTVHLLLAPLVLSGSSE